MEFIVNFMRSDLFLGIIGAVNIILLALYIMNTAKIKKINKNYIAFMKKLGNGTNLDEMIKKYINRVEEVDYKNKEILSYCERLDENISECIQKVGIIRYSAFKDTGSDLSFALALLDEKNNGVVLNGIYSREMSNIYAKPIINGKSQYTISEEEQQALNKAINAEFIKVRR
mgnify:CR=1 FL=1